MMQFGGAHSRQQILRTEGTREVVDAHFENGDAVHFAMGIAERDDFRSGERALRLQNDSGIEVIQIEDHNVRRLGLARLRREMRGCDDLATDRLQDRPQQSLQLNLVAYG